MSGANMQKYYKVSSTINTSLAFLARPSADIAQHSAHSTGLMRSVITMRQIGDDHERQTQTAKRQAAIEARVAASQKTGTSESDEQLAEIASATSKPVLGKRKRKKAGD
jgi:hypothetical protein